MEPPLILTAFGTASAARKTYDHLEAAVREQFPSHPLYWGYTSAVLRKKIRRDTNLQIESPLEILERISASGCKKAVVQSLHLFPGSEFHKLVRDISRIPSVSCSLAPPLLSFPQDYEEITSLLAPFLKPRQNQAVLVVGHGTSHPAWPAYLALERFLQARFGPHVFVGTIEHYPKTDKLEEEMAAKGYKTVLMIPFFLTAGRHFSRDMVGNQDNSWRNRLERQGLKVQAMEDGLGLLPGFDHLVVRHIRQALFAFK